MEQATACTSSLYNNRFLFTGREYYQELGLYNYRNRFYSPALNRFLQADPAGFGGDPTNLYRYCGNNPANRSDPSGLTAYSAEKGDALDIGYHGGDGTSGPGWGLTGLDVTYVSPVLLDQAEFAYSMAPYGTSLSSVFAGFGLFIGPGGMVTSGPPIRKAIPVPQSVPEGTVIVGVNSSQVRMIDKENSFSPSDWSDKQYTLQWSLTYNGDDVSSGTVNAITPRQAYGQTNQVGFATASGMVPGQSVTYDFLSYTSSGFVYNGWSVTATVIDPWGIENGALQNRVNLQNSGIIPSGIILSHEVGGGLSSFLYSQLPSSIQYNGYYYATPGHH